MQVIFSDDLYPGTDKKYIGKTIAEILATNANPQRFIKSFNAHNNKFCLSDSVGVDRKRGNGKNWLSGRMKLGVID